MITTTDLRINMSQVMDSVTRHGTMVGIGRRNKVEAYIVPAPPQLDEALSEATNLNAQSPSFGWLHDEPDIYSREDCQVTYR